ncbi:MAG: hypothetical protein QM750_07565 [Rubrivivax sp.]
MYLTPLHGKTELLKKLIANVDPALRHMRAVAEQLGSIDRWATLLRYVSERIALVIGPPRAWSELPATG